MNFQSHCVMETQITAQARYHLHSVDQPNTYLKNIDSNKWPDSNLKLLAV